MDDLFRDYDVLLTPAVAGEAPIGLEATGDPSFSLLWTTLHVPSITIPLFTGPSGLPVGVQLIARRGADRQMFNVARWVSRAVDWDGGFTTVRPLVTSSLSLKSSKSGVVHE
jgi:Asp-tRNA(Asn)/Glu-tRNA(Gln) amidotransferase A subunit family amidase